MILVFASVVLVVLRATSMIHWNWILCFIPVIIYVVLDIIGAIAKASAREMRRQIETGEILKKSRQYSPLYNTDGGQKHWNDATKRWEESKKK